MTPLSGFFKRILGASAPEPTAPPAPPPRGRTRTAEPDDGPPTEGERTGARRGSRGGRGRGGAATATTEAASAPTASASPGTSAKSSGGRGRGRASNGNGANGNGANDNGAGGSSESRSYSWSARNSASETDEQARQRREQASRQRRGGRPSFRPYREHLDQPLPEDIAFRSPTEGGDRTILPARRRRGTGLRDTERVLVGGARSLSGWSRPLGEPAVRVVPPATDEARPDDELEPITGEDIEQPEATDDATPRRRRRGRRGGRGRRRPGTVTAGETGDEPLADDLDDDEEEAEALAALDEHEDEHDDEVEDEPAVELPRSIAIAAVLSGEAEDEADVDLVLDEDDDHEIDDPEALADADADDLDDLDDEEDAPALVALHDAELAEDATFSATAEDTDDDETPVEAIAAIESTDDAPEAEPAEAPVEAPAATQAPARRTRRTRASTAVAAVDAADLPQAFADLGIDETTLQTIARWGFTKPSPIQERAIPALLAGKDVVGIAQTGSGKTVAFGVPMVACLDADLAEVQGIVLVPTRELASQVLDVLKELAAGYGLEAVGILGGHSLAGDFKALERRPAIVVGTPGRVIDHLQRGTLSLRYVRYAVLDEADQMLDIGFLPDIRRILSRTPKRRQTALFSATMPSTIRRLVWQFMESPETVTVDPELSTVDTIDQVYFEVATRDKATGLRELVERELKGRTLVFCKMKRGVDRLEADLARQGVRVGALHGDMDQRRRERVVQQFRGGDLDVLIATNVAARGLDIPEITHVVNYDVPQNPEEYVHRIGRTGRAGREGKAITFVSEWDMKEWDVIANTFGEHLRREELAIYAR